MSKTFVGIRDYDSDPDDPNEEYYAFFTELSKERTYFLLEAAPDLLTACKLAKQHLSALRCETPIADILLGPQKDTFRHVDETLTTVIAKAEGD